MGTNDNSGVAPKQSFRIYVVIYKLFYKYSNMEVRESPSDICSMYLLQLILPIEKSTQLIEARSLLKNVLL